MPMGETLDVTLVDAGDGWAVFSGRPEAHVYNPLGTVHGGWAATILDSACGCAVHTKLAANQIYTTLDLKVAFLKPITTKTGLVRSEGRTQTVGRRAAFAEADLKDGSGRLLATATATLLIMER